MRVLSFTADTGPLRDVIRQMEGMGLKAQSAQALVLNRVATRARQRVVPALSEQTGLGKKVITKAVRVFRASSQQKVMRAGLVARGGDLSLRFFPARETEAGGVSGETSVTQYGGRSTTSRNRYDANLRGTTKGGVVARIGGRQHFYLGAFRRSGRGENRRLVAQLRGATFINIDGHWHGRIRSIRSGVYIPLEMAKDQSLKAFDAVIEHDLPNEIYRELSKIAGA